MSGYPYCINTYINSTDWYEGSAQVFPNVSHRTICSACTNKIPQASGVQIIMIYTFLAHDFNAAEPEIAGAILANITPLLLFWTITEKISC